MTKRHCLPESGLEWQPHPGEKETRSIEREANLDGAGRKRQDKAV